MQKILFIIFLFFSSLCFGQTFEKLYGNASIKKGEMLYLNNDSGFYLLSGNGSNTGSFYSDFFCIIKTDQFGDSLSSNCFAIQPGFGPGNICRNCTDKIVMTTIKASLAVPSDTLYINSYGFNGTISSSWSYPDTFFLNNAEIIQTADKGFLIGSGIATGPAFDNGLIRLLKVDSVGTIQWKRLLLPYLDFEAVTSLAMSNDNNLIVKVFQSSGSNWAGTKLLLKLDTMGNTLWSTNLTWGFDDYWVYGLSVTDSGYFYLDNVATNNNMNNYPRIGFVDTSGLLSWSKSFMNSNYSYYKSFINLNNNNLCLIGAIYPNVGMPKDVLITEFNQQHDSINSATFGFPARNESLIYVKQLNDGRKAMIGASIAGFTNSKMYLVVVDSNFLITNVSSKVDKDNVTLSISPNPANSQFKLHTSKPVAEAKVALYNSLGILVLLDSFNGSDYSSQIPLDNGVYVLRIICKERVFSKKLIISSSD
jgi:Secretion system C-terminal sorting domain